MTDKDIKNIKQRVKAWQEMRPLIVEWVDNRISTPQIRMNILKLYDEFLGKVEELHSLPNHIHDPIALPEYGFTDTKIQTHVINYSYNREQGFTVGSVFLLTKDWYTHITINLWELSVHVHGGGVSKTFTAE